ncbi:type IV secretion system protein [Natronohydrobacter thiooxidans]|uniref:type IV secretion system protein n=1 Tax=Natronohydrobacter thiooxidans TaxID=87172 RepID=UPI0008FF7364|nr:type IV secretion system protein [Natronohydrobacter thiooxidans]
MSGIVSWIVGTVDGYLDGAGETTFGALVSSVGTIGMAMATLAVIFVALNAMLQVKSIDLRTAVMLGVKLALVGIFARNWAEFNSVTNAIIGGSERLAGVMVGAAGGQGNGSAQNFAAQFDRIISDYIGMANSIGSAMNWVGGAVFTNIAVIILAAMGAAAGLMMVFAKLMITFYVSIAPIMITMSLLNATKDYFQNWLTGIISYAFYPIIIAAVFSVIISMSRSMAANVNAGDLATLGQAIPFFAMIIMAFFAIFLIPVIMRQITGNIQLTSAMSGPMAALGTLSAARMAGLIGRPGPVQPAGPGAGGATRGPAPAGGGSAAARANARMARSARLAGR